MTTELEKKEKGGKRKILGLRTSSEKKSHGVSAADRSGVYRGSRDNRDVVVVTKRRKFSDEDASLTNGERQGRLDAVLNAKHSMSPSRPTHGSSASSTPQEEVRVNALHKSNDLQNTSQINNAERKSRNFDKNFNNASRVLNYKRGDVSSDVTEENSVESIDAAGVDISSAQEWGTEQVSSHGIEDRKIEDKVRHLSHDDGYENADTESGRVDSNFGRRSVQRNEENVTLMQESIARKKYSHDSRASVSTRANVYGGDSKGAPAARSINDSDNFDGDSAKNVISALEGGDVEQPKTIRRISLREVKAKNSIKNLDYLKKKEQIEEVEAVDSDDGAKDAVVTEDANPGSGLKNSSALKKQQKKKIVYAPAEDSAKKKVVGNKPTFGYVQHGAGKRRFSASQLAQTSGDDGDLRGDRYEKFGAKRRKKDKEIVRNKTVLHSREIEISDVVNVQDLAYKMAVKGSEVIKILMKLGIMVTLSQNIDADTAELVAVEFGHKVKRVSGDDVIRKLLNDQDDEDAEFVARAPVVTVMGHVDHGKTSLLDALRMTDVAAAEHGGITQHIGAYRVNLQQNNRSITFLDTPGHEAFTAMRMRGAAITDIIVLVIAADDGLKEQTIEAISHAKAAEVPIVVAVNKIDLPNANFEGVKNSLMTHGLVPDDYGGDVMVIGVSAKAKIGLDKLEEAILFVADVMELRAQKDCSAKGRVIEAKLDKFKGVLSTFLVEKGTLRVGDIVVAGESFGKVKMMVDDKGKVLKTALPSIPVEVLGLSDVPIAGEDFVVLRDESEARKVVEFRKRKNKEMQAAKHAKISLDKLFDNAKADHKDLLIILRGDVHGSLEAIEDSLKKIKHEEVGVKILMKNVGAITESDVALALTSKAVIMGFNVRAFAVAEGLADKLGVEIRYYSVIYDLIEDIKDAMSGLLKPTIKQNALGSFEVRQMFNITNIGKVAGGYVTTGIIKRHARARLLRDNIVVHDGAIFSLQRKKDNVKEVSAGHECGVTLKKYTDIHEGDIIEVYELIEEARKI